MVSCCCCFFGLLDGEGGGAVRDLTGTRTLRARETFDLIDETTLKSSAGFRLMIFVPFQFAEQIGCVL